MTEALIVLVAFVVLDVLSVMVGVDSRDGKDWKPLEHFLPRVKGSPRP